MSQCLPNGIELPDAWPPRGFDAESLDPLPVPYLDAPPEVIQITSGRQLFVDDFLVADSTLERRFEKPELHPQAPVLIPETDEECDTGNCPVAAPFNDGVWYDPQQDRFLMWYMPGWFHTMALATSRDGIHWTRPSLDVVPGTNLVWPRRTGFERDGGLVWLDHAASNPAQRFKMFQFYRYPGPDAAEDRAAGWLQTSPDGVHWSAPVVTTPVGDNTSFFYNPFRGKWCMSIRRGWPVRLRHYCEADGFLQGATWDPARDEVVWQRTDRRDAPDPDRPTHRVALYDLNVTPYESLMLGIFAIFRGPENDVCMREGMPKMIDLELGYSRDGFHFARPDRTPFLAASRHEGDWNRAYLHAAGGGCCIVGDRLFFYFGAFSGVSPRLGPGECGHPGRSRYSMYAGASTGLATLRRDGFAAMEAGSGGGCLTTRPVRFAGERLFVNAITADGELRVAVLDRHGRPLPGLEASSCIPVQADGTCMAVTWQSEATLAALAGEPVRFRFHLRAGKLYAFWVTDDPDGASYGYVAAGGPGFKEGKDLPGTVPSVDRTHNRS